MSYEGQDVGHDQHHGYERPKIRIISHEAFNFLKARASSDPNGVEAKFLANSINEGWVVESTKATHQKDMSDIRPELVNGTGRPNEDES